MKANAVFLVLALCGGALAVVCLLVYLKFIGSSQLPLKLIPPALASRTDVEPNLVWHVLYSTGRGILAFTIALAIFLVSSPLHRTGWWRGLVLLVSVSHAIPPLVWVPLVLLTLGVNEDSLLLAGVIFVIQGLLVAGQQETHANSGRGDFYRLVGVSTLHRFVSVEVPDLLNETSRSISMLWLVLIGVVIATEYIGSVNGVGRALSILVSYADTGSVAAVSFFTGLVTIVVAASISAVTSRGYSTSARAAS